LRFGVEDAGCTGPVTQLNSTAGAGGNERSMHESPRLVRAGEAGLGIEAPVGGGGGAPHAHQVLQARAHGPVRTHINTGVV